METDKLFSGNSYSNCAWVRYGYATRDGEYAEFCNVKYDALPDKDDGIYADPYKVASYTGEVVNGVRSIFEGPQKRLAEEYMNQSCKKNRTRICEIETTIGRLSIAVDGTAGKMIPSRERLWEPQFKETVLTMSADTSYAKTIRFTNTLLAREHDSLITRNLIDLAWREGHKAGECYKEKRNTILPQYGFNAETG